VTIAVEVNTNLSLTLLLMVSTVLQVIYGATVVHRVRKGVFNLSRSISREDEHEDEVQVRSHMRPIHQGFDRSVD
jgi:hypothetical protein